MSTLNQNNFNLAVYYLGYHFSLNFIDDRMIQLVLAGMLINQVIKTCYNLTNGLFKSYRSQAVRVLAEVDDLGFYINADPTLSEATMIILRQSKFDSNFYIPMKTVEVPAGFEPDLWLADAIWCERALVYQRWVNDNVRECYLGEIKLILNYEPIDYTDSTESSESSENGSSEISHSESTHSESSQSDDPNAENQM